LQAPGIMLYNSQVSRTRLFQGAHILFAVLCAAASSQARADEGELKLAVILSRHGVRAPLSSASQYAGEPWPSLQTGWKVADWGYLTARGKRLVEHLGRYYREYFAEKHLLPEHSCPAPYIYIWADNVERTIQTAEGVRNGLVAEFPSGCDIPVNSYSAMTPSQSADTACPTSTTDPLFHPLAACVHKPDPHEVGHLVTSINRKQPELLVKFQQPLLALQRALGCPGPTGLAGQCTPLLQVPAKVAPGTGDDTVKWSGPFDVGSTASETFLLEYADGMPCIQSGWGRVDYHSPDCEAGASFREMESIHTLYFDLTQRARYAAKIEGSNLLHYILKAMEDVAARGSAEKRIVFLAGHDTNVANVSAMLDMSWDLPDLPRNDTPPGGALVFELYGNGSPSGWSVKVRYVHQTVEQLRNETQVSLKQPPNWVDLAIPGCHRNGPCEFEHFRKTAHHAIDKKFVSKVPAPQVNQSR
jgi:4-phytase/acid phosphatase